MGAAFLIRGKCYLPAGQEGFEYHLLVLGICVALFIMGGGRYSVDQWLTL
jgi:putative oxidoreductase